MNPSRISGIAARAVVSLLIALAASSCRMTPNHPVTAVGPDFAMSYEAAQRALKEEGYAVAKDDAAAGELETEQRHMQDWWWVINVKVKPDGEVAFMASGSDRVQKGNSIHRRVLNFANLLRDNFNRQITKLQIEAKNTAK